MRCQRSREAARAARACAMRPGPKRSGARTPKLTTRCRGRRRSPGWAPRTCRRARWACPNQARPLSKAPIGIPEASTSSFARRSSSIRSPDTSRRLAASVVGSSSTRCSAVGLERVDVGGAERGQQVVAHAARVKPGQREPLEDAAEAALRRPALLARERGLLRAGALDPRAVGGGGLRLGRGQRGEVAVVLPRRARLVDHRRSARARARAGRRATSPARCRASRRSPCTAPAAPAAAPPASRRPRGARHRPSPSCPGRAGCGSRRRWRAAAGA